MPSPLERRLAALELARRPLDETPNECAAAAVAWLIAHAGECHPELVARIESTAATDRRAMPAAILDLAEAAGCISGFMDRFMDRPGREASP